MDTNLQAYLNLEKPVVLTQRCAGLAPQALNTDKGHSFETYVGRRVVSPADYAAVLAKSRPEAATAIADEVRLVGCVAYSCSMCPVVLLHASCFTVGSRARCRTRWV